MRRIYNHVPNLYLFTHAEEKDLFDSVMCIYKSKYLTTDESVLIESYAEAVVINNETIDEYMWGDIKRLIGKHGMSLPPSITTVTNTKFYKGEGNGSCWRTTDTKLKSGVIEYQEERLAKRLHLREEYWGIAEDKYKKITRDTAPEEPTEDAGMLRHFIKKVEKHDEEMKEMTDRMDVMVDSIRTLMDLIEEKPTLTLVEKGK